VQQQKLATIEDVAAIAGVSIATVSRAINEPTKVAESTRHRVNDAIARTGYTTNAMARSLRMRRSNMILILAPDVGDPNFSNILVGLETEASKRGYGVLIGNTQNDPTRESDYLRFISSNQADGLILLTGHLPFGFAQQGPAAALPPIVAVNEPILNSDIPFVGVDNFEGARLAAEHLISQGHRRVAFIGRSTSKIINQLRERGYRAALEGAGIGIDPLLILDGDGVPLRKRRDGARRHHRAQRAPLRSAPAILGDGVRRHLVRELRHPVAHHHEAAALTHRRSRDELAADPPRGSSGGAEGSLAAQRADPAQLGRTPRRDRPELTRLSRRRCRPSSPG
jgi:DNA-binding LacI/PurR family transcriptional regulator